MNEQDVERISEAVRQAEKTTSGEIVPMVVRRSSSVGHVPLILGLLLLMGALFLDFNWLAQESTFLRSLSWLLELLIIFLLIRFLAPLHFIQRWLSDRDDLARQVEMRAELEFYEHGLQKTTGATGILIFVSLMERRAVILADSSISSKLPPDIWDKFLHELTESIHQKQFAQGMLNIIGKMGELITAQFPRSEHDHDELPNELIVKD